VIGQGNMSVEIVMIRKNSMVYMIDLALKTIL